MHGCTVAILTMIPEDKPVNRDTMIPEYYYSAVELMCKQNGRQRSIDATFHRITVFLTLQCRRTVLSTMTCMHGMRGQCTCAHRCADAMRA